VISLPHVPDSPRTWCENTDVNASPLRVVPANEASWADLESVLGTVRRHSALCFCQGYKIPNPEWRATPDEERAHRLRDQTDCDHPDSELPLNTSGLVGYLGDVPVGWCAVEPRTAYRRLLATRIPWADRTEDRADVGIWAVTCFVIRVPYRRSGYTYPLTAAAVEFARDRGAKAIEGYPMITRPGKEITWGELHVGSRNAFAAAGFTEVSSPTKRRVVMRIDF
jgi:GNAT superfamily N-acetyltransferase